MNNATGSSHPALIALDWGSSNLRAYLLDGHGAVIDSRESSHGIRQLPAPVAEGGARIALAALVADWLAASPGLPLMAAGMIGSRQGWHEVPYQTCPAALASLGQHGVTFDTGLGSLLTIAPGLIVHGPGGTADVMRGEETQVLGALQIMGTDSAFVLLPGTHAKWVQVKQGVIITFGTYMTGELFALLQAHSLLGAVMPTLLPDTPLNATIFLQGVAESQGASAGDLLHLLFGLRARVLAGRLEPASLSDHLSGLLIGAEVSAAAQRWAGRWGSESPLVLVGTPALCERYALALKACGMPPGQVVESATVAGLWRMSQMTAMTPSVQVTEKIGIG